MKIIGLLCLALVAVAVVVDYVTAATYDTRKLNEKETFDEESLNEQSELQTDEEYISSTEDDGDTSAPGSTPTVPPPTSAPVPPPTSAPVPPPTSAPVPPSTPAPPPKCVHVAKWIDHDKIKPFPQPPPVSLTETSALKFQPLLRISSGCDAYPMVTAEGETSGGLKVSGPSDGNCKGAQWGSQIYGRSTWFKGYWVTVFLWYFPKDSPSPGFGHRHDFEQVILWIDNPANDNPKILCVTPSAHGGFSKHCPPHPSTLVNDTHVKLRYFSKWPKNHELEITTKDGGSQDLIMWHQLPEKARCALNTVYWGSANLPIRDESFWNVLEKAYPF